MPRGWNLRPTTGAVGLATPQKRIVEFDRTAIIGNSCLLFAMRLHQEDVAVTVPIRFSLAFALG